MVQAIEPDSWTERFLVTLQPKGGTATNYYASITTYDRTGGEKDFTQMANAKGGRIKNFTPQTEFEITLEGYFTQVGNTQGIYDYLHANTSDSAQPLSFSMDHSRQLMLLSIMHTTDESVTSAVDVTTQDERAIRDTYKNGHIISINENFTDNMRKTTIKFKVTPFAKDASSNVTEESTDGSASSILPAITYV